MEAMNNTKKIVVFGATGLIGQSLVNALVKKNYSLAVVSRNTDKAKKRIPLRIDFHSYSEDLSQILENAHAVINLAGENIAAKPWSKKQKQKIIDSRVISSRKIISKINELQNKPCLYLQASATGYYPFSYNKTFTEESEKGNSFLSRVVDLWENETTKLDPGIRKVLIRTGIVLSKNGGMLQKMLVPMKLFIGGKLGSGKQWISWIHINDEIKAILYFLENDNCKGAYNLAAPEPVTMHEFTKALGKTLQRPTIFTVPSFIIKLIFGDMGKETILGSQRIYPKRLTASGFTFDFPNIDASLIDLLK